MEGSWYFYCTLEGCWQTVQESNGVSSHARCSRANPIHSQSCTHEMQPKYVNQQMHCPLSRTDG